VTTTVEADSDLLHDTIYGWNVLRLEWICRALAAGIDDDDDEQERHRVFELRQTLAAAGPAAHPVLVDPRFGRWCAELTALIERDAPALLPAGRFRAACRDAGAFALAARFCRWRDRGQCRDGDPAAPPATVVRVRHDGRVPLPGTGWTLVPGIRHAGLDLTVSVAGDGFAAPGLPGLTVVAERASLPGLVASAGDPVDVAACAADPLLASGPPAVVVERGDDGDVLAVAAPGIAVVRAAASPTERAWHALAAAAQLRAVVQQARLFEQGAHPPEPAPEVAHLADAPQLIRLLMVYRQAVAACCLPDVPAGDNAEVQDKAGRALRSLAGWLGGGGQLSPLGQDLLSELAGHGLIGPAPSSRAAVSSVAVGGALRSGTAHADRLTAADPQLQHILTMLGSPDGIVVNTLSDGRSRADPTIDQLSLLRARSPERYQALARELVTPARCLAEELLLCHLAYVDERFGDAAAGYASLLRQLPHDIDLWRDFAFALRHLGEARLSETVVFRLGDVARAAVQAGVVPAGTGDGHQPPAGRWRTAPADLRRIIAVVEEVSRDSDPR